MRDQGGSPGAAGHARTEPQRLSALAPPKATRAGGIWRPGSSPCRTSSSPSSWRQSCGRSRTTVSARSWGWFSVCRSRLRDLCRAAGASPLAREPQWRPRADDAAHPFHVRPSRVERASTVFSGATATNDVAALPSLHGAYPALLLLFFWRVGPTGARGLRCLPAADVRDGRVRRRALPRGRPDELGLRGDRVRRGIGHHPPAITTARGRSAAPARTPRRRGGRRPPRRARPSRAAAAPRRTRAAPGPARPRRSRARCRR